MKATAAPVAPVPVAAAAPAAPTKEEERKEEALAGLGTCSDDPCVLFMRFEPDEYRLEYFLENRVSK
ncbi:MAG: hypothetical protein QXI19_11590 [Candidatus Caldarchaeum sp.]